MTVIVLGLSKDPAEALDLMEALGLAGFADQALDGKIGLARQLASRGVPLAEAEAYAESVRLGSALICIPVRSEAEGEQAMEIMDEYHALGRVYLS